MKSIDEVNLMDDVFMNLVASDPDVGEEFCRTLLSVLLQKEVGKVSVHAQRVLPGSGMKMRGIRLDVEVEEDDHGVSRRVANVYDIEPHNRHYPNFEKMMRFRQSRIDSRYMKESDNDFSHLPNLYMILITDCDYFHKDYMLYTFRNRCEELPELDYKDGLTYLYFNTGGTCGGSEAIRNMLLYMQNSREQSAVDEATSKINEYVQNVRRDPEIRGNYMTLGDRIDWEKEISREEGREEARDNMIIAMLNNGMTVNEIANKCNLSYETVKKVEDSLIVSN